MNRLTVACLFFSAVVLVAVNAAPSQDAGADIHNQLQEKTELLLKLLKEINRKLMNAGKKIEAQFFEKIEEAVLDIDNRLREWHPTDPLGQLILKGIEKVLHDAEVAIEKKLEEIGDLPDN